MLLITVDNPADPAIHSNTMGSSTFNYLARCPTQKKWRSTISITTKQIVTAKNNRKKPLSSTQLNDW